MKTLIEEILTNDLIRINYNVDYDNYINNEEALYETIVSLDNDKECIGWGRSLSPLKPILNFFNIKESSKFYIEKELLWYESQSLSVDDIQPYAKLWGNVCSSEGKVNSNYGWAIFSKENGSQYENVKNLLIRRPQSKQGQMIYTRPSMHKDAFTDGMKDFMCCSYVQCFIRNNKLLYIIHQRSCDFIYGFFNDFAWHCYVYHKLYRDLLETYKDLEVSNILYLCDTLHIYEKHYALVRDLASHILEVSKDG